MTSLPDLFADAVAQAPPSRLSADDVYSAWRRRRRRNTSAVAALLVGTLSLTVTGGLAIAAGDGAPTTSGAAPPSTYLRLAKGDAAHLYGLRNDCPVVAVPSPVPSPSVIADPPPPDHPCYTLMASVDGGATWAERGVQWSFGLDVLGPTMLLRAHGRSMESPRPGEQRIPLTFELSTDAGVTWRSLTMDADPAEAVPPGGALFRSSIIFDQLQVVDPMAVTIRPLAHQPALTDGFRYVAGSGSTLWVNGLDAATRIPAVAVSQDRGRSWTVTTLPGAEAAPEPVGTLNRYLGQSFAVLSTGETVAYAIASTSAYIVGTGDQATLPPVPKIYRTADGGHSWQVLAESPSWLDPQHAWATTRGELVLCRPLGCQVSVDGKPFTAATLPGLPADTYGDGALRANATALYVSEDGWTWRRL